MFSQKKYRQADAGYKRVARKIFAAMILLPLVPFLSLLVAGFLSTSATLEEDALWKLNRVAVDHARMLDAFLSERIHDLEVMASLEGIPQLAAPGRLETAFAGLKQAEGVYVDLGVIDPSGRQVAYQGSFDLLGKEYDQEEWYRDTVDNGLTVSDVFLGYRGMPHFIVAVAGTGESRGWVLRATIDNDIFSELVESVGIGRSGQAFLMNRLGKMQTANGVADQLMIPARDHALFPELTDGVQHFTVDSNGDRFVHVLVPVNNARWRLVVRQEHSEAFEPLRRFGTWVALVMALGGALIVAAGWLLSSRLYKQMMLALQESETLKEQLIRAARLAELGEMAAGIAHEINNPLQTMNSELTLMGMDLDDAVKADAPLTDASSAGLRESIEQVKIQIQRCAKITAQILKFGRYGEPERLKVDLGSIVPEVVDMVVKKASVEGVDLNVDVPQHTPQVFCDPGQLHQVLLNLLNNALDAVVQRYQDESGGRIGLAVSSEDATVRIVIQDNGTGVSDEVKDKIFSPFFTTKPVGKGTGLGLSICFAIVESMGGSIDMESKVGRGTRFTVTLPAA